MNRRALLAAMLAGGGVALLGSRLDLLGQVRGASPPGRPTTIGPVGQDILELAPPPADQRLRYGDHRSQFVDLYLPPSTGPFPVVLLIHGGYWRAAYGLEHMAHLAAALRERGIAAWSIEYRRLGDGGGWPHTFLDAAAGAELLRTAAVAHSLDPVRVVSMGFSAGGHLALWLAARSRIDAVSPLSAADPLTLKGAISLAGVSDLQRGAEMGLSSGVVDQLLGGSPGAFPERLAAGSPYELLPLGVAQLLIHGQIDPIVPIELSRRYVERARSLGDRAELVALADTGHFELIDPRMAQGRLVLERVVEMLRE